MQFNPGSSAGIIDDITFFLGGIDTNEYSLAERTRNVNERQREVWSMIFESYGGWRFMDANTSDTSTGLPYGEQTITSGTGLYGLPSAALTVDSIAYRQAASGPLFQLKPLTFQEFLEMGGDGAFPSNGVPLYYLLQGDVIRLLPIPNFTLASTGLRVYFDQDMGTFVSGDTSRTPGFASPFHRLLSIGAALDYAEAKNLTERIQILAGHWNRLEARCRSFYRKQYTARYPNNLAGGEDLVGQYS